MSIDAPINVLSSNPSLSAHLHRPFSRKRSEEFPFIVWGSGGWTRVRVVCAGSSRSGRGLVAVGSLIPCRGDWWWACRVCGSVPWGLLVGVSRVWRCAVRICWGGCCVGGAVSFGLVGWASCRWRCVIGIGGQGVVWVALCHWDWWGGRRVAGAVPFAVSCGLEVGLVGSSGASTRSSQGTTGGGTDPGSGGPKRLIF